MEVSEAGNVNEVKPVQLWKAEFAMEVRDEGVEKLTEVNPVQL